MFKDNANAELCSKSNKKLITITLTNDCNLNCIYCYEHNKSTKSISADLAKEIIKQEFDKEDDFAEIEFDLFGGEPFLEWDLIRELSEYISLYNSPKKRITFISTNGTLVHGKIQDYLLQHRDFLQCGLSIDGTPVMHNMNRSNSFDLIDTEFFCKTYPNQGVKMTVSVESLRNMYEGVLFLHRLGFKNINCNLAYNINWDDAKHSTILAEELFKLISFYLNNPDIKPCSILNSNISQISFGKHSTRWCGAGIEMRTYDVNGDCYPCQFFMPLSCGVDKAKKVNSLKFYTDEIPVEALDKKCRNCSIQNACPVCVGSNYARTGNLYGRDENYCKLMKIIIKARSYFRAKQWELGQLNGLSDQELSNLLTAIDIIQNTI